MAEVEEINEAFEIAKEANLTREELEDLQQREIFIQDQFNAIKLARRLGGEERTMEIAERLLNVLDDETISQTTGLSLEKVKRLRAGNE